MKRKIAALLAFLLLCGCLSACGIENNEKEHPVIVATIFPLYDWVNTILGENPGNIEVKLLLENGVDLHSYQPTAEDVMTIGESDLFLYVGGESDGWVKDAIKTAGKKKLTPVSLLDALGDAAKTEELVEGMQAEEEEEEEEEVYDEHIWLSLRNAITLCNTITDEIIKLDSQNAETYKKNLGAYTEQLKALDEAYKEAVSQAATKTILFGDRFPFRYMTEDYGLNYYAAFMGCSAESEASFETIAFLAEKVDELSLSSVIVLDGSNHKIAETIIRNTEKASAVLIEMNSLQSISKEDIKNGVNYLSVMRDNLDALKSALQ